MAAKRQIARQEVESTNEPIEGRRQPAVAPATLSKDASLFEYLAACQPALDKKIIDIVLAQTKIPRDLRNDAAQEIRLAWSTLRPETLKFKPGQIASYAHRIATHSALRLRRELGCSVRLPGSAFRKRKDGSTYVTPGMLAVPLDWNELESWFNADGHAEGSEAAPCVADAAFMPNITEMTATDSEEPSIDAEEATHALRLAALERNSRQLSRRQYKVMAHLIAGASLEDIESRVGLKKGHALREFTIAAAILGSEAMGTAGMHAAH
jgi:hypothetical protein